MRRILLLIILFLSSCSPKPEPRVYGGTYTTGLVISESNVILDGANISNTNGGVCLRITGDNVTVRNSVIHDCMDHGVQFVGTNGGLFENNEVYRAAMMYKPNSRSSGWPSLVKVQSIDETEAGIAQNIIIRNNYIHEGYGEGMGLRGSNILVEGNTVKDTYSFGIYSNSDHTTVRGNFVLCTGNPEYNRGGLPMIGIGNAEEVFAKWGAHGHDSQVVVNNIVSGCKFGYRYGYSSDGYGLIGTIAFNTFYKTTNAGVSITSYNGQSITIHNNISTIGSISNKTGISIQGNVTRVFDNYSSPEDFKLTGPLPALGTYQIENDYSGKPRTAPEDAGAWDWADSPPVLCENGIPEFITRSSGLYYYCTYPVPGGYQP